MPAINGTKPATQQAAVWNLDVPASPQPAETTIAAHDGRGDNDESAFPDDDRAVVDLDAIKDNGQYRSIVKIQSCFKNEAGESVWMMGSGWLIRDDLLVTAGHVVFDWGRRFGPAIQLKCYIGYNGRASVKSAKSGVQARYGKTIVTTADWIKSSGNRRKDVAFVRVDRPFTGSLRVFNFVDTPPSGTYTLGVVGYPGDMSLNSDGRDEKGAQMYEQYRTVEYNLDKNERHMIEYKISTFGGQSGAPILRLNGTRLSAIGTHCYGGGGYDSNSGNSIGGIYGNNYEAFLKLFKLDTSTFGTPTKIKQLDIPSTIDSGDGDPSTKLPPGSEEGFIDALKMVAKIGSVAVPIASGLLGPLGGLVGSAAGALLGSVAEASTMGAEGSFESEGAAERALLAEASLQAVLNLPSGLERKEILANMKRNWITNAPKVDTIARVVTPQMTECALDIAVEQWGKAEGKKSGSGEEAVLEPRRLKVSRPEESSIDGQEAGFVEGLFGETRPLAGEPEALFDWLGPVLKRAVTAARPLVSKAAKAVVTEYGPKLLEKLVGHHGDSSEAGIDTPSADSKESQVHVVLKRALMADAALQALMSMPQNKLRNLKVNPRTDKGEPEGIFDYIKTAVQKMGPVVLDTARKAVKKYGPIILDAVARKLDGPTKPAPPGKPDAGGLRPPSPLRRQPSLMDDLLNGDGGTVTANDTQSEESPSGGSESGETDEPDGPKPKNPWDSNDDLPPLTDTPPDF